eukprot:9476193-Pyramimonas_sp.AAC.1
MESVTATIEQKAAWLNSQTGYTLAVEANDLLVHAITNAALTTCTQKEGYTEHHADYARELKVLLHQRREVRDRLAWAYQKDDDDRQLQLTVRITTISKWLRQHKRCHWQRVQQDREAAFEEARKAKDFHE